MPEDSLRRLGGGRWQTRDGRFTIEPQGGTWVLVDGEQVDELGLPLVRGPFRSLGDAREAIDRSRREGPSSSPLAERIEGARGRTRSGRREGPSAKASTSKASTPSPPRRRAEPAWLGRLDRPSQRRARDLMRRIEKAGVADAERVARSELVDEQPALARLAIERRVAAAMASSPDVPEMARKVVEIVLDGKDEELDAAWRLVDASGRRITRLTVSKGTHDGRPA